MNIAAQSYKFVDKNLYGLKRLPLWSSGHSSWLQIQRFGFYSWCYQIFWEVVGLEQGPLSLMSTTEELLGKKKSYAQKLALALPTSSCCSVGIVCSRTEATEVLVFFNGLKHIIILTWSLLWYIKITVLYFTSVVYCASGNRAHVRS
jgi:hypothetical protein